MEVRRMIAMTNVEELYASAIRDMPSEERLRLAALILNDLTQAPATLPDFEGEWTEEDIRDARLHFMRRAEERYAQEDDLA